MDESRSLASKQLIKISPRLKEKINNLKIVVVGGGDDEENAKASAVEANEKCGDNTVILTGARVDINKIVAVADLFVGVSRAALEAMAAGKNSIIAGNEGYIGLFDDTCLEVGIQTNFCCRGCRESTGELIYDDIIKYISLDDEKKKAMSEFCRKTVIDYYSVAKMTDDCCKAYDSLLK